MMWKRVRTGWRAARYARACALAAGAALLVAGCSGDAVSTNGTADGTMSSIVDTKPNWSADKSVVATLRNGELTITGTEKSGRFVKMSVVGVLSSPADENTEQRFVLSGQSQFQTGFAQFSEGASHTFATTTTGGTGTIVITQITPTRAVGTFTFVGVRQLILNNEPGEADLFRRLSGGQFDVRLQ